jgi:hypothetical protein
VLREICGTETVEEGSGENCMTRSLIICAHQNIWLVTNERGLDWEKTVACVSDITNAQRVYYENIKEETTRNTHVQMNRSY